MTSDELRRWMEAYGFSVRRLADTLVVSHSTVGRWRAGQPIPQYLTLALETLESRLQARSEAIEENAQ